MKLELLKKETVGPEQDAVYYSIDISNILFISQEKAKTYYICRDCTGTEVRPHDTVMRIHIRDIDEIAGTDIENLEYDKVCECIDFKAADYYINFQK